MDATKSYVTIYNISTDAASDFEFDYDAAGVETGSQDILTELVPDLNSWGDIGWMECAEYEYHPPEQAIHLTMHTKWASPVDWLTEASHNVYFQNKLMVMTTTQKDETQVTGIAVMDGEILQNKTIFDMDSTEVGKYYDDDEPDYELDDLDNKIWDSIGKFVKVCEQFYLEREEEND
tara:strand:+ start:12 stop:542 length:531 start_codon:yes stop_codon:yes gene_type:complete